MTETEGEPRPPVAVCFRAEGFWISVTVVLASMLCTLAAVGVAEACWPRPALRTPVVWIGGLGLRTGAKRPVPPWELLAGAGACFALLPLPLRLYMKVRHGELRLDGVSVTVREGATSKTVANGEVVDLRWPWTIHVGEVVLKTSKRRLKLSLVELSPEDQRRVVRLLRESFPQAIQRGWTERYQHYAEDNPTPADLSRRSLVVAGLFVAASTVFFAMSVQRMLRYEELLALPSVLCAAGGCYHILRFQRQFGGRTTRARPTVEGARLLSSPLEPKLPDR